MKRIKVNTTYNRPDRTLQPIVKSKLNKKGELVWTVTQKTPWHLAMFPNHYNGDFGIQWMLVCLTAKGFDINTNMEV